MAGNKIELTLSKTRQVSYKMASIVCVCVCFYISGSLVLSAFSPVVRLLCPIIFAELHQLQIGMICYITAL